MVNESKLMLWRLSAGTLGAALPAVLLGRGIMFALIIVGILSGLAATKGDSLRATKRLMLNSWLVVLVIAMLGAWLVSTAYGVNPAYSFGKWTEMAGLAFAAGLLFFVLREMPGAQLELLLKVLAIGTIGMAGLAILDATLGDERLSAALHGADKALTPYRLNSVSSSLAVLLPFVWARLMLKAREGEPFALKIALPATALGIAAALVSGGRAGWAGLFAAMALFMFLAGRWHGFVVHARGWLVAFGTLAVSAALYAYSHGWAFFAARVTLINEGGRGPLSGRLDVWQKAVDHLGDNPLFGIGLQGFRWLPNPVDLHPHNWVLQMGLETGIIGILLFVLLMGLVFRRFWTFAQSNIYGVAAVASLGGFMVAGLANTSIFNMWWSTYLVFILLLGWRAGWGGADLASRRRARVVPRQQLVAEARKR